MFPSFTGSTRPRRQVNLSGRNTKPFAAASGSRQLPASQIAQNTLAHAQQERLLRQQERERPPAATKIQRVWRGFRDREIVRSRCRREWDNSELIDHGKSIGSGDTILAVSQDISSPIPYKSEIACLSQVRLLIQFASPRLQDDILRLRLFAGRYLRSLRSLPSACPSDVWIYPLLRLAKVSIAALIQSKSTSLTNTTINMLLALLATLSIGIPKQLSLYSRLLYRGLAEISSDIATQSAHQSFDENRLEDAILGLLQPLTARTITAYEGFVVEFLVVPYLSIFNCSLDRIARKINYRILASAVNELLQSSENNIIRSKSHEELLWLLAYFIYFCRAANGPNHNSKKSPDTQYIRAVSRLISHLADEIGMRIDILSSSGQGSSDAPPNFALPLPTFVRNEILTLVNQDSVSSLLANLDAVPISDVELPSSENQASVLANFALTLLRCFPRRADEIRMWLYLGSTSRQPIEAGKMSTKLPAVKYLYQAAQKTNVYNLILKDPHEAIGLLKANPAKNLSAKAATRHGSELTDQQWRVILLFLELYTFVLKVMDDEEFFSGSLPSNDSQSWTRQSALPLDQIKDLTIFLKNLAFSMYWNASELCGVEDLEAKNSIAEYFSGNINAISEHSQETSTQKEESSMVGLAGMTLSYMKGMVTGLLRMVYERE